jgi:cell division protease FtsH
MGPAKKSKKYTEKERRLVAYHEAGHSVVGIKLENASQVQKIAIVPRGEAGGYNLMMPKEETDFHTKTQMLETITGLLGGRVAEELVFNEISTGSSNDFQNATNLARSMVTQFGMSALGPVQYEQQGGSVFLGRDYLKEKNFSDQVALEIDREQRRIIEECYERGRMVICENMDLLTNSTEYLLKIETINKRDIDEIVATGHLQWCDEKCTKGVAPKEVNSPVETIDTPTEPTTEGLDEKPEENKTEALEEKEFNVYDNLVETNNDNKESE